MVAEPFDSEHVEDEQRQRDPAAAVQHPRAEPVEVGAAVVGERDDLTVELQARGQAAAELGQQVRHVPAASAGARKPACVQTRQRNPSSFGSNVQPRPIGIVPVRASIGSGSRRPTRALSVSCDWARNALEVPQPRVRALCWFRERRGLGPK